MNGAARRAAVMVRRLVMALCLGGALLAAGCSSLRLAYGNAETLLWWWLDGYADFRRDQKPQVRGAIGDWLAWHRRTQLPQYRDWLQQTARLMQDSPDGAALCAQFDRAEAFRAQALQPLAGPVATLAPLLQPAQWRHIEQHFAKKNGQWADQYLQPDPQVRRRATLERSIEHFERLYGPLARTQETWLARRLPLSPWRAENDFTERQWRQHETLLALKSLAQPGLGPDAARTQAAAWLTRLAGPMDERHRLARAAARDFLCELVTDFHREQATPAQHQHLQRVLQGWSHDIDGFLQDPGGGAAGL